MSNPLGKFLEAISGGRSVPRNDVYMPDWSMVSRKDAVLSEIRSAGEKQANHACTCKALDCELHFTDEPTWLTTDYFIKFIEFSLNASRKAVEDGENEEAIETRETIDIYLQQWRSMSPEQITTDPRYHAFAVGFNGQLLQYIIQHYSYRVPKH